MPKVVAPVSKLAVLEGSASLTAAIAAYCAGGFVVAMMPWYTKPLGYVIMGLAMTGLYDIAFGCTSLSKRRLFGSVEVSRVIGQASLLLLLRPLQSLHVETLPEKGASLFFVWLRKIYGVFSPRTLIQAAKEHGVHLSHERARIALQYASIAAFAAVFFPTMILKLGWSGLVRFWLVPFFFMHFQMGTFRPDLTLKQKQHLASKFSPYGVLKECATAVVLSMCAWFGRKKLEKQARAEHKTAETADKGNTEPLPPKLALHPFNIVYLSLVHLGALYALSLLMRRGPGNLVVPLVMAGTMYFFGALGITAGVHRLWAHRSYEASLALRLFLMVCNSVANQGSILKWSRDHRVHHKHVDTDKDPHNATLGFWWSHIGWLIWQKPASVRQAGRVVHMDDLYADSVVMWQHRNYVWFSLSISFAMPAVLGSFWGCTWECYWIAGLLRYACCLHATWMVNSAAHLWGYRPYVPDMMPAENWIVSLFAIGEGWHNYHHSYPYDYSTNEYGFLQLNPTTGFINMAKWLGMATNLRRAKQTTPTELCLKDLPEYTMAEMKACANQAACLMALDGVVYDLTEFEDLHPGGPKILKAYYGKNATDAFHGGVHKHTVVATNMLSQYAVGRLPGQ